MSKEPRKIDIANRKAGFNFHIEQRYTAGIQLTGTEVKSIRAGNVNLGDAYCVMTDGEMFVKHLHISPYENSGYSSHEPMRERKLLLNKQELRKIELKIK